MSILAYLAIALAIFLAGSATGWKAHVGITASRDLAALQAQERETLRRIDKIDTSAVKHEQAKTRIETEFVTITERVRDVVEKPVYRNICLDDGGLRLIADAINGPAEAASQPKSPVSRPNPTD